MAESTLLHTGEEEPDVGKGHGTGALGPSDSSDSGSDVQGGPGLSLNEDTVLDSALSAGVDLRESHDTAGPDIGDADLDSDTDASGTGERAAAGRDALSPDAENKSTLLQAANNHRILRRGRKFGTKLQDPLVDDGADRGLLFMCLNTDIDRQFEFVQQTWLLNSSFATMFQEVDPLVGPAGPMTIRIRQSWYKNANSAATSPYALSRHGTRGIATTQPSSAEGPRSTAQQRRSARPTRRRKPSSMARG